MKILIRLGVCAHIPLRKSWANALSYSGHNVRFWDSTKEPLFDSFDRFKPDLFIGETHSADESVLKVLKAYPETLCTMVASDWGVQNDTMDLKKYGVLVAREDEKRLIERMIRETGRPNFVHCQYFQHGMDETHNHWLDKLGLPYLGLPCSADVFEYLGGEFRPELECDLSIVSGYWGYKARNIDKYITPLCHPVGQYNIKIFGNSHWPVVQYCGALDWGLEKHLFRSTKICMNVHEPHANSFHLDFNERSLKVPCAGGFILEGGKVESLFEDVFKNGEVDHANTTEEYREKVDYYLKNPEVRGEMSQKAQKTVIDGHTAFDRFVPYFEKFGMLNEVENLKNSKQKFLLESKLC